jgi:hypothetical protein
MARGRYTIVGKLTDGGMAEIFLARQHGVEGFHRPVVLKRILSAFSADPQFRNMFIDEAHISMSLSHGNIVPVLDAGMAGERMFLALELVEGWDLGVIIARAQAAGPAHPWPPSLALFVAAQICRGLAYAHAKLGPDGRPLGIVHRDVSPANILLSEQGEVKLTDFGIAKAERKREKTAAGVIKGKIGFMSPEQARGHTLDARADLFSVGAVLYLMLTGRKPFEGSSDLESLMRAQKADYVSPESLNPYLSPDATAIVNRAMRREVEARYQTADQMLLDLERVLRERYHSAGQTELKAWLGELARRDGQQPMGRVLAAASGGAEGRGDPEHPESARPMFVDRAGDLSAGTSVELSDLDVPRPTVPAAPSTVPAAPSGPSATSRRPLPAPLADASARRRVPGPLPAPAGARGVAGAAGPETPRTPGGAGPSAAGPGTGKATAAFAATSGPASAGASAAAFAATEAVPVQPAPRAPTGGIVAPATLRFSRRSRTGLGFLAGAVCMLGAVLAIRSLARWAGQENGSPTTSQTSIKSGTGTSPGPTRPGTPAPSGPAGSVTALGPVDARTGSDGAKAAELVASDVGDGGPAPPRQERPDGGAASAGPPSLATNPRPSVAHDEDEEHLLARVIADRHTVIGEDEAEAEPEARAAAEEPGPTAASAAASSPARTGRGEGTRRDHGAAPRAKPGGARPSPASTAPVQVRITTSPLGAVVRTKKQVIGRTPVSIRFKPGSTYELTFVKAGYATTRRPLQVRAGKSGSMSVALKKLPPAAPTLRQRLFPGR